jgi:hypothetical protein
MPKKLLVSVECEIASFKVGDAIHTSVSGCLFSDFKKIESDVFKSINKEFKVSNHTVRPYIFSLVGTDVILIISK